MLELEFKVKESKKIDLAGLGRTTRPVFQKIMRLHKKSVEERFSNQRGVDGKYWKALKDRKEYHDTDFYPEGKKKLQGPDFEIDKNGIWKKRPLDMKMIGSMRYNFTKDKFEVVNSRKYAAIHEFGSPGGRVPKRSFMGFSKAQEKLYTKMIAEAVGKFTAKKLAESSK